VIVGFSIGSTAIHMELRLGLLDKDVFLVIEALIHCQVNLVQYNAVSRHSISLVDLNNISNNEFTNKDRCGSAKGTPVHCHLLVVDLILELEMLPFFDPIADRSEGASKHQTGEDGQGLNRSVMAGICTKEGSAEVGGGSLSKHYHISVLKLLVENR
jgi:hypothetical protein